MTETNQNHFIEKLTDALTAIGLDIREIKTTLSHFGEKFDRVHQDVHEIKSNAKENEQEIESLMLKNTILENEIQVMKKDVQILFSEFKGRDSKSIADRKWLIGTIISVVLLGIAVINQFI